ncbi:MAG: ROK family protein [Candidatus Marinimicrobia bacterium]|nr:ROK family protein [Candidatus Neomarinimicrobiota bacterium]
MSVIAVDLKTNKISTALLKIDGEFIESKKRPLGDLRATQVGRFLCSQIDDFIHKAASHHVKVKAIGISVPGIFYEKTGVVWAPNIPGWRNYPLIEDLKKYPYPVRVMSDRCCHILAEQWKGAAKGCKNVIYYSVGSGIYAGIMIDGRILRGNSNIAGAIGWISVNEKFENEYKKCGYLEYFASAKGIADRAHELANTTADYDGPLLNKEINVQDVFNAYKYEDPVAEKVLDQAVKYWGISIANLVSVFNPSKIILGGSVFGPATQFIHRIYEEAARWAQPISMQDVTLELSELGNHAGLVGAGRLALIASEELQT